MILLEHARPFAEEPFAMVHDLVLAIVFLGMIIGPALITMRPDVDEKDPL
jgi:hypothetical protein